MLPPWRPLTTTEAVRGAAAGGGPTYGGAGPVIPGFFGHDFGRGRFHVVLVSGTVNGGGSGANFTLTATGSTLWGLKKGIGVTVDVSSHTRYLEPGVKSPSVLPNEFVDVLGTRTGTEGTINGAVVYIPAVQLTGNVLSGGGGGDFTLSATSSTIWGLKGTSVTVDVNVTPITTRYREPGVSSPTVAIGDVVQVSADQTGTTGTVNAVLVVIPAVQVTGDVTGGGGSSAPYTFTLTSTSSSLWVPRGTAFTINVSTSTKVREPGVSSPTVATGDMVQVVGTQTGTANNINATSVVIFRLERHRGVGWGFGGGGQGGGNGYSGPGGGTSWGGSGGPGGGGGPGNGHHK